jgi:phosphoglycolate phosphatase
MKTAILFDLDGTLLNTLEDLADATNAALAHFGYPARTLEEIRTFVGNGAKRQITLAMGAEPDDPRIDQVLAFYKEYYNAHCQIRTAPYAGIMDALAQLQDFPMAVVSNKPHSAVKALAEQFFPGMYARGEQSDCPRKPAPDMIHRTMADLGVEKCIYVGDSEVDILTAKNAGVPCLSVLWGFRDRVQLAEGSHFCEDVAQLPEMIRKIAESLG